MKRTSVATAAILSIGAMAILVFLNAALKPNSEDRRPPTTTEDANHLPEKQEEPRALEKSPPLVRQKLPAQPSSRQIDLRREMTGMLARSKSGVADLKKVLALIQRDQSRILDAVDSLDRLDPKAESGLALVRQLTKLVDLNIERYSTWESHNDKIEALIKIMRTPASDRQFRRFLTFREESQEAIKTGMKLNEKASETSTNLTARFFKLISEAAP